MPEKRPPRDPNQLAKYLVDVTTGEAEKIEPPKKNPHAQALSRLGASKGGRKRALTTYLKRSGAQLRRRPLRQDGERQAHSLS